MTLQQKLEAQFQPASPTLSEYEILELFISEYRNLSNLVEKWYSNGLPDKPNSLEKKLITYQENLYSRPAPPTEIKLLTYEWQRSRYFIIPGYMTTEKEILQALPEIIAINIKQSLFMDGQFTHPNKCLPQIKWLHINDEILGWLFDHPWREEQWENIINALKAISTKKNYQALLSGLSDVREETLRFSDNNFEEDRKKWEEKYALRFPINHYNIDSVKKELIEKKLNEEEDRIYKLRGSSQDNVLALKEFLHLAYKPLRTNGELDKNKYITGLLREYPIKDEQGVARIDRLDTYLKLAVAATLRDRYDRLIRVDLAIYEAGECKKEELLMAALALFNLRLFKNANDAIRFISEHFKVKSGQGAKRKLDFIKPATLTKLRTKWESGSAIPSAWRSLKNKIDDHFSS